MATIAFYGPNLSQATKVAVGIMPSENAEVKELRDWKVGHGDVRADSVVTREILEFMEKHGVLSVAMTDAIIGCPHQEGIDYEGEWCPVCEFWHGLNLLTVRSYSIPGDTRDGSMSVEWNRSRRNRTADL